MSFQGKTAVITGASSGIGLLCAQCFAEQGANIVMLATNPTKLQSKVDALTAKGYHAIGIPTDVRNYAQVADAFQKAKEAFSTAVFPLNSNSIAVVSFYAFVSGTVHIIHDVLHPENGKIGSVLTFSDQCKEQMPSSRRLAMAYRTIAFRWVRVLTRT